VYTVRKTEKFAKWLDSLTDLRGRARILARIERLACGHVGDVKPVGVGVVEMRINCGPGYRVYFTRVGKEIIVLLVGGDKSTQAADIRQAIRLVEAM
jgi:putative addiction module killer protein